MKNLREMLQKIADKKAEARKLIDLAEAEKRNLSQEERSGFDTIMEEAKALQEEYETEVRKQEILLGGGSTKRTPDDPQSESEFRNLGELIYTLRNNPVDSRLKELREMAMGANATGGIFVPTQFSQELFKVDTSSAIVRPRATVIPAGDQPDASINFPTLKQGTGSNIYGGVEVEWINEGGNKPDTNMNFGDITLTPQEVAGSLVITDKLLRNAPAMSSLIEDQFRGAINAAEDVAFISGDGKGKPLGYLNSESVLKVNRKVANKISYEDVLIMLSKAKAGGTLTWVTTQSILPQLMQMKNDAGNLIWQPNAIVSSPGSLLGVPIVLSERVPLLGKYGDLSLVDFKYYLIKDGAGIFISASEHVLFKQNKTMIKAFWNVDGKSWLEEPITLENGYQVSPFVVLDVPSV